MTDIEFCTCDDTTDLSEEESQIEIPEYEIIKDKPKKRKKKDENKILRKVGKITLDI